MTLLDGGLEHEVGEDRCHVLRAHGVRGLGSSRDGSTMFTTALGWDTDNIVAEMGVSTHTVRNHSTNLCRRLDVGLSLKAVMVALRFGILTCD